MNRPEPAPLPFESIERVTSVVASRLSGRAQVGIEEIQDEAEETLMDLGERQVGRRYIVYRAPRTPPSATWYTTTWPSRIGGSRKTPTWVTACRGFTIT